MRRHVQPCPYCSEVFQMEPMTHTTGDLVLCPSCGVALRFNGFVKVYERMTLAQWLTLTNEDQADLIRERRTLALTHVMVEDWRYEFPT